MSEQDISLAPPDHSQELTSAEKDARAKELDAALSDLKEATSLANENVALRTQLAEATRKLEEARKDALEQAAAKCENIADKIGDMNAYNNCHESCCDNSAMRMAYGCAEAIRAIDQAIEQSKGRDDDD